MTPPRVSFDPLGRSAEARADETVLDVARRAGAPIANACGGVGVCNRCNVRQTDDSASLGAPTSLEIQLRSDGRLAPDERLACQATVLGDCTITTKYWG